MVRYRTLHVSEQDRVLDLLLSGIADAAEQQGMGYGQLALPHDADVDKAINQIFSQPMRQTSEQGSMMARIIADDFDESQLNAIFAAHYGIFWEIDRF